MRLWPHRNREEVQMDYGIRTTEGPGGYILDSSLRGLQAAPSQTGTLRQARCWEALAPGGWLWL